MNLFSQTDRHPPVAHAMPTFIPTSEANPLGQPQQGYDRLLAALMLAYEQAACGKGADRHGRRGAAFEDQPMGVINGMLGSTHGFIFQASKKSVESTRLPKDRAIAELLGAINYLAGAVIYLQDQPGNG